MNKTHSILPDTGTKPPNWWLRQTSSGWDRPAMTTQDRELRRRSTLASWLILGLMAGLVIASPLLVVDVPSRLGLGALFVSALVAALLNRHGYISATGMLLTAVMILAPLSAITPEVGRPGGGLDLDGLPIYDLLVLAVLFAALLLRPSAGFWVAGVNIVLMFLNFTLQPHDTYLRSEMLHLFGGNVSGTVDLLVRPAGLQVVVAVLAYLGVRGIQQASVRADLAEQELALQQRYAAKEAQQRADVQYFIEQVLAAHVAMSHGQQPSEVVFPKGHPLAKAASFLNAQLFKLSKLRQQQKLEDPLLTAALRHLVVTLRKIESSQPGTRAWFDLLHPQAFETHVGMVDETAHHIFEIMYKQLDYAYKHTPIDRT